MSFTTSPELQYTTGTCTPKPEYLVHLLLYWFMRVVVVTLVDASVPVSCKTRCQAIWIVPTDFIQDIIKQAKYYKLDL